MLLNANLKDNSKKDMFSAANIEGTMHFVHEVVSFNKVQATKHDTFINKHCYHTIRICIPIQYNIMHGSFSNKINIAQSMVLIAINHNWLNQNIKFQATGHDIGSKRKQNTNMAMYNDGSCVCIHMLADIANKYNNIIQ